MYDLRRGVYEMYEAFPARPVHSDARKFVRFK